MAKELTDNLPQSFAYLGLSAAAGHSAWTPNTDVYETPDHLVVKVEIAGINKDDLEITVNDRLLLVRGYRKDPCRQRQHRCSFRQMEVDYGYFERRIVIPPLGDCGADRPPAGDLMPSGSQHRHRNKHLLRGRPAVVAGALP